MLKPADGILTDEAVHLCQKALYIEPLNYPIEEIRYPTNGHEHIYLARQEAEEIFPERDFSQCIPMFQTTEVENEATPPIDKVKKSFSFKQWKNDRAYTFSCFALELNSHRNHLIKKFPPNKLPPVENEEDVCLFCLGSDSYKIIFKNENVHYVDGHRPLLSHVLHLSQQEIFVIVKYMSIWINQLGMNDDICMWLHSLLACLNKPVSNECGKFLELFYDDCVQKIKNCNEDGKYQLHYITAILKKYFCVKSYKIGPSLDNFLKLY